MQFIGLRPGEKLHESLFYEDEAITPTGHPKVLRARGHDEPMSDVLEELEQLVNISAIRDPAESRAELMRLLSVIDRPASAVRS
jgi:FlaA1/EpsC-like NDP-sugar epimerase